MFGQALGHEVGDANGRSGHWHSNRFTTLVGSPACPVRVLLANKPISRVLMCMRIVQALSQCEKRESRHKCNRAIREQQQKIYANSRRKNANSDTADTISSSLRLRADTKKQS